MLGLRCALLKLLTWLAGLAALVLLMDLARALALRSELQTLAMSLARAAAPHLDGSAEGMERALAAVARGAGTWRLPAAAPAAEAAFGGSPSGPWYAAAPAGVTCRWVHVRVRTQLPMMLLPAFGPRDRILSAEAVASREDTAAAASAQR